MQFVKPSYIIHRSTEEAPSIIEYAGRTCYNSTHKQTNKSSEVFIKKAIKKGHLSILEHASVTVEFYNVSRAFTHQLVRHRISSFSQQSLRYVNKKDLTIAAKDGDDKVKKLYGEIEKLYNQLLEEGWKKEDVRAVLPIATATTIIMTANFRQWRHVFKLRCKKEAQKEIRTLMQDLLSEFILRWPSVFDDLSYLCVFY